MGAFNTHSRVRWRSALAMLALLAGLGPMPRPAMAADPGLVGTAAPDFALRSASGANLRLSEHRGDVVVLSFWSSRCNVCRA